MVVFDVETTPEGELVLIGVVNRGHYRYFTDAVSFWKYLKKKQIKEVFAHNLEFDFFKIYEYNKDIKFSGYFSTAGLSYVQAGNIFFKDLYNHAPFSLEYIGGLLGLPKLKIDYSKIRKITKELIRYNKRDCEITYLAVMRLKKIYGSERMSRIKSTTGSQAMNLFLRRFFCSNFRKIPERTIEIWRSGYRGGWVEVFESGEFEKDTYYKIDINSLFPFIMRMSLPYPYSFFKTKYLTEAQRISKYWLGVKSVAFGYEVYNSMEHRDSVLLFKPDYYYVFRYKMYPFRKYVDYLYGKRIKTKDLFDKQIYKKLLNSLYGKFGQKSEVDVVSNYNYKKRDNIFYEEPITEDLRRIKFDSKNKYWVNIVWSLFITAKARYYMSNMLRYISRRGIKIYYIDTDAFIISGDINRLRRIINPERLGLFKIEDMSNSIDIRGKKMYRFGDSYKCKGVPKEYRKEFFENGSVQFKKMLKYKEALTRGQRLGSFINYEKRDLKNRA